MKKIILIIIVLVIVGAAYYTFTYFPSPSLVGGWSHAREEDSGETIVYRNEKYYSPSLSRYRERFTYAPNNTCSSLKLAPNDAHYMVEIPCSLTQEGSEKILTLNSTAYTILEMTKRKLLLKKRINLSLNSSYCEKDSDCIAVKNPSNGCYYGYFNKDATDAINEFTNNPKPMVMDCPTWSEVYCDSDNTCTADRDNK